MRTQLQLSYWRTNAAANGLDSKRWNMENVDNAEYFNFSSAPCRWHQKGWSVNTDDDREAAWWVQSAGLSLFTEKKQLCFSCFAQVQFLSFWLLLRCVCFILQFILLLLLLFYFFFFNKMSKSPSSGPVSPFNQTLLGPGGLWHFMIKHLKMNISSHETACCLHHCNKPYLDSKISQAILCFCPIASVFRC